MHSTPTRECFEADLRIDRSSAGVDELKRSAPRWQLEQIQLEPGNYRWRIRAVHTARLQLGATWRSHGTRITGKIPGGCVALGIPYAGRDSAYFRGRRFAPDEIPVVRSGEDVSFQPLGESRIITVALAVSLADEIAVSRSHAGFDHFISGDRALAGGEGGIGVKARLLLECLERQLAKGSPSDDEERFEREVAGILFDGLRPAPPAPEPPLRCRLALDAEAYALEQSDVPFSLDQLCAAIGAQPRTVELGFLEAFGLSMKAYVQALRFNGARRDLQDAEPGTASVKAVALKWGFRHMGRFSTGYKAWFGECPGATLARAEDDEEAGHAGPA
jgi:AraC-like DNA-binding protein